MKATDVAKYIIAKCDSVGDPITNKKLQKLLYYVKAWGLVYFAEGVIGDQFVAWVHGPVCIDVYHEYKDFGYKPIAVAYTDGGAADYIRRFKAGCKDVSDEEWEKSEMIDAVFNKYGVLTSLQLELMTHSEKPWQEARAGLAPTERGDRVISEETMRAFYGKGN